jgi:hypothetical protein
MEKRFNIAQTGVTREYMEKRFNIAQTGVTREYQGLEKGFNIAKTSIEREHQSLEKGFNIAKTSVEREHHGLEKGFNIAKTSIKGGKLHYKDPQKKCMAKETRLHHQLSILHPTFSSTTRAPTTLPQQPYLNVFLR